MSRKVEELEAENAKLKREVARLENALDLVPSPEFTPGQPRPNHEHRCVCGGCHE